MVVYLFKIFFAVLTYPFFCICREIKEGQEARIFWEEWEKDSFKFEGKRWNKKYAKVVDGKIVHNL